MAGAYAFLASAISFVGWVWNIRSLMDWVGTGITMKANTAVAGTFAGLGVLLLAPSAGIPHARRMLTRLAIATCGVVVSSFGLLTVFQHVTGTNLGIDTLLFDEAPGMRATDAPGRMGLWASGSYSLIGLALVILAARPAAGQVAAKVAWVVFCMVGIPFMGYIFGADFLFTVPKWTGIAFQTATILLMVAIGLIFAVADRGLPALLRDRNDAGGVLARQLLVPVVLLPILLGWLMLAGQRAGLYDMAFGMAMIILVTVLALGWLVLRTAGSLSRSAEDLLRRDRLLNALTEHAQVGLFIVNPAHQFSYVNRSYAAMFGVTPAQLIGREVAEIFGRDVYETSIKPHLNRAFRGDRVAIDLTLPASPARQERQLSVIYEPQQDHEGVTSVVVAITDLTEPKRAEAVVRESERRFKTLSSFAPVGMFETDPEGNCLFVNDRWCELTGLTAEEARGQGWSNALHPSDRERVFNEWYEAAQAGREFVSEYRFIAPGGKVSWVSGRGIALRNTVGEIVGHVGTVSDITELKMAEQARARLAAIVTASDDAIISKDLNGIMMSWNAGAERVFGYTAQEAIGRSVTMLMPEDRVLEESLILDRVRRGERIAHFETTRRRKDGTLIDVSLSVSPLFDERGNVIGASKISRDITQLKRDQRSLARHAEALEEAVRSATAQLREAHERQRAAERLVAMGTLAAGLGHDMANLLLPINVRLDLLAKRGGPELVESIRAIKQSLQYLHNLATSLKMLAADPATSTQQGNRVELRNWWEQVSPLLRNVLPRGATLESAIAPDLPLLNIAPHQLTQAIFNLVQNAGEAMRRQVARPQSEGRVKISASAGQEGRMIKIEVADNGPGMTDEVKAHCLEPFFSTKPRAVTTGMGLSLVNGIIQAAGGTLEFESELGKGTIFVVMLPAWESADEPLRPAACTKLRDGRMRAFAESMLSRMGFSIQRGEDLFEGPMISLWVTDSADEEAVDRFLSQDDRNRVVYVGSQELRGRNGRLLRLDSSASFAELRNKIVEAVKFSEDQGTASDAPPLQEDPSPLRG